MLGQSMKIEHTLSPCAILHNSFQRTLTNAKVTTSGKSSMHWWWSAMCTMWTGGGGGIHSAILQCAQCEQEEEGVNSKCAELTMANLESSAGSRAINGSSIFTGPCWKKKEAAAAGCHKIPSYWEASLLQNRRIFGKVLNILWPWWPWLPWWH